MFVGVPSQTARPSAAPTGPASGERAVPFQRTMLPLDPTIVMLLAELPEMAGNHVVDAMLVGTGTAVHPAAVLPRYTVAFSTTTQTSLGPLAQTPFNVLVVSPLTPFHVLPS